jgi:hypothetical protein
MYKIRMVLLGIFLTCSIFQLSAQELNLEWASQIGGSCWEDAEEDGVTTVAVDTAGNVYTAGFFCGTSDFDPGASSFPMTSAGYGTNYFIYKLNKTGVFQWAKMITTHRRNIAIALDAGGNVYATGTYAGIVDFDPGPDSFKLNSSSDPAAFILKLDTAGDFVWAKSLGGLGGYTSGTDIAIDTSGNIYSTGSFNGTGDFDPGTGANDTFKLTSAGSSDIYISKLTANGNFIWAKRLGGTGNDIPVALALGTTGQVHIKGNFKGTADFDPGTGTANLTSTGYEDVFIAKLDAGGNFAWAKAFLADGASNSYNRVIATSIAIDATGNVYSTGYFGGTVDFDPSTATNILTSTSPNDMYSYISKLDNAGNFVWVKQRKGTNFDIVLDSLGNNYTTGMFSAFVDFDPGAGTANVASTGGSDVFVTKLTDNGDFVYVRTFGGSSFEKGYAMAVDRGGKTVHTVGSFAAYTGGQADFDPGPGTMILTSGSGAGGDSDGFIHKMSCNTYATLTITACDSFNFGGITYQESGIYTPPVLPNANGCDSIVTINLTITHSTSSTITESACNSFSLNGETYTTSGNYLLGTFQNAAGCDSLLMLDLTIDTVNTSVTQNGNTFHAGHSGATYQWVDCEDQYAGIPAATQQDFTAPENGSYAVIVTVNGCSDTSDCFNAVVTGIGALAGQDFITITPNPVTHKLTVKATTVWTDARLRLISITGKVLMEKNKIRGNSYAIDISPLPAGIYILELKEKEKSIRLKVTKL